MRVRWSQQARADLIAIGRYIAADDRAAARRFVARLKARAVDAGRQPRAGRRVPELMDERIREVIEGNYRIVYEVGARAITVLTVFEGHRTLPRP
jgi:toxin ParE1/3/4